MTAVIWTIICLLVVVNLVAWFYVLCVMYIFDTSDLKNIESVENNDVQSVETSMADTVAANKIRDDKCAGSVFNRPPIPIF